MAFIGCGLIEPVAVFIVINLLDGLWAVFLR